MDFYDSSLTTAIDHDNCIEFQQTLSSVGEAMAERFALEDRLIRLVIDTAV
ncbi:MAG: Rsd/AlgQ family anti-sigma factor [Symbiopectobacterium sp.]